MAFEKPLLMNGFKSASDLSAASQQFCLVKLDSSGNVVICSAATDIPIGVLQNSPQTNETAEVMMAGITKLRVGGTDMAQNALVGTDSTGRAATIAAGASTAYCVGRVLLVDNADNDAALVTATIDCLAPTRLF